MPEISLRKQLVSGLGWSAVERFSLQAVQFVIQIVMARMLLPSDFAIIGMLAIFLQLAQVFIDSGFANALIQKQDCTDRDYSTVFYYNLGASVLLYICCFAAAPAVASFYSLPLIIPVMKVQALTFLINSLAIIPKTILVKAVNFKTQSKVSLISALGSGLFGIYLAYSGFGVWALCSQSLLNSILQVILLYIYVKWKPSLIFDLASCRKLFDFGSKILGASIIGVIYNNLYTIVIGKCFDAEELGLYSKADQFAIFPSKNLGSVVSRIAYPVLSKLQGDEKQLLRVYRKLIRYSSFIIFPLMFGLVTVAEPMTLTVLGENWLGMIPFLQILSLGWMFDHLSQLNLNILYVKGRSDLVFRLEIIKKAIAVVILFSSISFGPLYMCWGRVMYSVIALMINTFYTARLLEYGFAEQVKDFCPFILASVAMAVSVYWLMGFADVNSLKLIGGVLFGILIYGIITIVFFKDIYRDVLTMIKK